MLLKPDLRLSRVIRVTWKVDLWMIGLCTGAYLLETYLLRGNVRIPNNIPALLATTLAFFIGFNNNQAYSRWWEARTIWGALVNDSRSWTRSLLAYTQPPDEVRTDQDRPHELVTRLIRRNLSFVHALKSSLRSTGDIDYQHFLEPSDLPILTRYSNIPAALLDLQAQDVQQLRQTGQVDGFAFLALNELLVRFSDSMGRCERIKNTLFPVTYLYFTRVFIWLMIVILTIDIAEDAGMWPTSLGWLIGFVFHVTHLNGLNLVNPFDGNPASVPLDSIVRTIEINVLQTLHAAEIPGPVGAVDGEYIL